MVFNWRQVLIQLSGESQVIFKNNAISIIYILYVSYQGSAKLKIWPVPSTHRYQQFLIWLVPDRYPGTQYPEPILQVTESSFKQEARGLR